MKQFYSTLIFTCYTGLISGQEIQKDSVTYLPEVIIVDPAKNKAATGITSSNVIRGKFFQNQSPVDLASSINQVSGVYMLSGALNTNRVTIRGVGARTPFGTDKLRLYFNDIPVTNGTGFSTLEAFDMESLEAIEIIKGPKGTAFGANLGGAMLLTTKKNPKTGSDLANSFTVGSYGLVKNTMRFNHTGETFSMGLQYGSMEVDGYRENSAFERNGILLNAHYTIKGKHEVSLLVNQIGYNAQIASSISKTAFEEDPQQAASTWKDAKGFEANSYTLLGISYSHRITNSLTGSGSIFYTYLDHYEPRPFNILDEFTNGFGFRSRISGSFPFAGHQAEFTFGGELYKDEYKWGTFENLYQDTNGQGSLAGTRLSDNKEYRRQFNGFGTLTLPLASRFNAQIGLAINKTHYDFRDLFNSGTNNKNAKRNFDPVLLPSLDMEYALVGGSKLYGNISRGFSNPSLEESLTPNGVINPDIAQETGTNYEAGSKIFWPAVHLWMDITLYRMDIKNLLVSQRVGQDQYIGKNAGKTRHQGLEFQLDHYAQVTSNLKLSPFIGYTYSDHSFVEFVDDDADYSGNRLTGVPRHRLQMGMRINYGKSLYWSNTYQFVGAIPLTDANTTSSDSFGLLNSRLGYTYRFSERFNAGIDLGANNILDVRYAQSVLINAVGFGGAEPRYYYPGNDRNYYGGLQLHYMF